MEAALTFPNFRMPSSPRPIPATDSADGDDVDVALMRRIAEGDERAFRDLVERHQNAVVGTVARMLGDPTEAEDIAQLAFLRIWKHAKRWRPDAKFSTWLWTIARNTALDHLRRKHEIALDADEESAAPVELVASDDPSAEARLVERAEQSRLEHCMGELSVPQREALTLRTVSELAYEEIARAMDTSLSSVKSLIHRAKAALTECLKTHAGEAG